MTNKPQRFAILICDYQPSLGACIPKGTVGEIKNVGSDTTLIDFDEPAATGRWLSPYSFREIDAVERLALLHAD